MKLFQVIPTIHRFDGFAGFAEDFGIAETDIVITHEFLYNDYMKNCNLKCKFVFQEKYGTGEPSDEMIDSVLADTDPSGFSRVIAVGGGTVIDIAKIFALKHTGSTAQLFMKQVPVIKEKQLVIVPTTCGTGSEVTNLSIVEIKSKNTKLGLGDPALFADDAVLIPQLVRNLPYKFFVFSAIDALIHASESMVSPKSNPYTEIFAERAIEMILSGFAVISEKGEDARKDIIEDFLVASNYAGIAFSNTGVGAVHALSYPLGAKYHVPHGESNYLFFTAVMQAYYAKNPTGKIDKLTKLLCRILDIDDKSKVFDELSQALKAVITAKKLHECGMTGSDIEDFAQSVIEKQQRLLVNSCEPMDFETVFEIYKKLY